MSLDKEKSTLSTAPAFYLNISLNQDSKIDCVDTKNWISYSALMLDGNSICCTKYKETGLVSSSIKCSNGIESPLVGEDSISAFNLLAKAYAIQKSGKN